MSSLPRTRRHGFAIAAFALLVLAGAADAQTVNWTGASTNTPNNNWSDGTNWSTTPNPPTSANTINFGSAVTNTANLTTNNDLLTQVVGVAVGTVGNAGLAPITIGGNALTLTSATSIAMTANSATQNLTFSLGSNDLTLAATTAWTVFTGRTLTINAAHLNLSNTTTGNTLTITINSNGTVALNAPITDSNMSGATPSSLSIQSNGTTSGGNFQFNDNSTYTGTTTLNARAGNYQIGSDAAFGIGGLVTNQINSVVANWSSIGGNHAVNNPVVLSGGFLFTGSNNLTFGGAVTATAGKAITYNMAAGTSLIFNGPVTMGSSGNPAGTLTTSVVTPSPASPVGMLVFNGVISEAAGSSSGLIVLLGNGSSTTGAFSTDEFTAQNTYSGGTTMSGLGCLAIVGSSSQGPAGAPTSGPLGKGIVTVNDATLPKIQALGAQSVGNNFTLSSALQVQGTDNLTLTGVLSSGGGLLKIGTGTLSLTGANTYSSTTFGTQITGGALLANNGTNGSATGTSVVSATGTGTTATPNVGNGGVLGGTGTISGAITIGSTTSGTYGGVIYPGQQNGTAGTLNVGSMTWNPFGRYVFAYSPTDLGMTTGGGVNDLISGAGTLDLSSLGTVGGGPSANPFDLNLSDLNYNSGPEPQSTYTIAAFNSGILGNNGTAGQPIAPGTDVTNLFTVSGDFADPPDIMVIGTLGGPESLQVTFTPVPEPGTLLLLSSAAAGGLGWYRRRRAVAAA